MNRQECPHKDSERSVYRMPWGIEVLMCKRCIARICKRYDVPVPTETRRAA